MSKEESEVVVAAPIPSDPAPAAAAAVPMKTAPELTAMVRDPKPPGNCPEGGVWGTVNYVGEKTKMLACGACLCCGCLGCCVLACPQDEKDAYCVNGKVYDAAGEYVGPKNQNFVPARH